MKKNTKTSIFNYTPSVLEIEGIIKKFPREESPTLFEEIKKVKANGEVRIDKFYKFKNSNGKISQPYRLAHDFDRGYAFVMQNGECYYIDPDFTTVICEEKIKNCEQLYQIMKSNRDSVLKYVSTQKIEELREPVITSFLLGEGNKKTASVMATMIRDIDILLTNKAEQAY